MRIGNIVDLKVHFHKPLEPAVWVTKRLTWWNFCRETIIATITIEKAQLQWRRNPNNNRVNI